MASFWRKQGALYLRVRKPYSWWSRFCDTNYNPQPHGRKVAKKVGIAYVVECNVIGYVIALYCRMSFNCLCNFLVTDPTWGCISLLDNSYLYCHHILEVVESTIWDHVDWQSFFKTWWKHLRKFPIFMVLSSLTIAFDLLMSWIFK